MQLQHSILSSTAVEESLVWYAANDFKLFAEREVPLELRSEAGALANDAGSVEAIRVRVLVRGVQPDLEAVRVCIQQQCMLFQFHTLRTHILNISCAVQLNSGEHKQPTCCNDLLAHQFSS